MNERKAVNVPVFLMSLFLALALWGIVVAQSADTTDRSLTISLEYLRNLDPKFALVDPPSSVTLDVVTSSDKYKDYVSKQWVGQVSLSGAQVGKRKFRVALPPDIRDIVHDGPFGEVELVVEPLERRRFPITVQTKGHLADSSVVLRDHPVQPQYVDISGPRSAVAKVSEARITLDLSQEDPSNPSTQSDYIYLYDSRGVQIPEEKSGIRSDPQIGEVNPMFTAAPQEKTVFAYVKWKGHPNSGFRTDRFVSTPDQVTITGSGIALASLSQIETETVDLTGLTRDHQFIVPIKLPPGVTRCVPKRVKVRVTIVPAEVPATP